MALIQSYLSIDVISYQDLSAQPNCGRRLEIPMYTQPPTVQQNVLHLISQIQCEDIRRKREKRENNRQNLTVPVIIRSLNTNQETDAISRDLSSMGIGLLTNSAVETDCTSELELQLESGTRAILGKCCWCEPFGRGFFLSGWKFQTSMNADSTGPSV